MSPRKCCTTAVGVRRVRLDVTTPPTLTTCAPTRDNVGNATCAITSRSTAMLRIFFFMSTVQLTRCAAVSSACGALTRC